MSKLSWGKPLVEFTKSVNGAPSTEPAAVWTAFSEIKEGTAQLTVEEGEKVQATEEGGEVIDTRVKKNKYIFELQLFAKKGDENPLKTPTVSFLKIMQYALLRKTTHAKDS